MERGVNLNDQHAEALSNANRRYQDATSKQLTDRREALEIEHEKDVADILDAIKDCLACQRTLGTID